MQEKMHLVLQVQRLIGELNASVGALCNYMDHALPPANAVEELAKLKRERAEPTGTWHISAGMAFEVPEHPFHTNTAEAELDRYFKEDSPTLFLFVPGKIKKLLRASTEMQGYFSFSYSICTGEISVENSIRIRGDEAARMHLLKKSQIETHLPNFLKSCGRNDLADQSSEIIHQTRGLYKDAF